MRSTIVDLGFLIEHVKRMIPKIIYFINLHSSSFDIDMEITYNMKFWQIKLALLLPHQKFEIV